MTAMPNATLTVLEVHIGCGGIVRLSHDSWRCATCGATCSVHETESISAAAIAADQLEIFIAAIDVDQHQSDLRANVARQLRAIAEWALGLSGGDRP